MGGLFGPGRKPSAAQDPGGLRKGPCGCFCGGKTPDYVVFEDQNCAGILAADACGDYLANLPREQRERYCQHVKARRKFTSFKDSCPVFAQACEPDKKDLPPETNCEKPTPWFDRSSKCDDVQSPQITVNRGAVSLSMCGSVIFSYAPDSSDPLLTEAYKSALRDWVQQRVGSKICCTKFREASRTGKPCDPRADLDCDGRANQTDVVIDGSASYPDLSLFTSPEGAAIDRFPAGLDPDDPDFMPESTARNSKGVGECDCKWELIKGDLKCSPDGKQQHVYVATWRCPSTKAEVFTTKYAPATAPCP